MQINVFDTQKEMAVAAAEKAAEVLKDALQKKPEVRLIAATGNSQLEFLAHLRKRTDVDWKRVVLFHLDEYVGLGPEHPASFVGYIKREIVDHVPLKTVHYINGKATDPEAERRRLCALATEAPMDLAFVGIGENGHLAFNDPPADFETEEPYLIVQLDERCRMQQVGEGWFPSLEAVPKQAFSMSIKQILKTDTILCICPEKRKAEAVRNCLGKDREVSPLYPASALKLHSRTYVFLDRESASLL
ncbi:MAG: glucosamine-6-phosphate deaminase [Spirochaetes bacterium]|nr:glucosamine-6-phosphate deaminase [Spirochaetota bacterium]